MAMDPLADFDREIVEFLQTAGIAPETIQLQVPPRPELGERASNAAFGMARVWRRAPQQIAAEVAASFDPSRQRFLHAVEAEGGFINFRMNYAELLPHVLNTVREAGSEYGRVRESGAARRVVVEHTSVNPNKEWHVGHTRNAVLGDVVVRLLDLAGDEVEVQNYIDDTGVQAAQSVVALRDFPEEQAPGEKYDHYVGRGYVKIAAELGAEQRLRRRLAEIEEGAEPSSPNEVVSVRARLDNIDRLKSRLIRAMHELEDGKHHDVTAAILNAQLLTAYRLGIYYDLLNWESHLVQSDTFDAAIRRLEESPRVCRPTSGRYTGALTIETGDEPAPGEERKAEVLIRSNGIPTYVGKDIAYHMWKFQLLPDRLKYVPYATQPNDVVLWSTSLRGDDRPSRRPDAVINIIDVTQTLPQQTVKEGLRAAGFGSAADDLVHLAYGFVSTPEGKISGRKGTALSGDSVIDEAVRVALDRVREKRSQDLTDEEMVSIAEAVGVGAVRYFMVQYNPLREIVFDVSDVVSYDGNTALYIQYALVRMFAILRRARDEHGVSEDVIDRGDPSLLVHDQEKRLALHLAQYPNTIATATRTLAVNLVAEFAYDLAVVFSQFYRDCGVLNAAPELRAGRLLLVRTVRDVLANACGVLGVPVIEKL
jgi:arginyl-tRNA synthetase